MNRKLKLHQSGFTIVELLVGLLLSLFIIGVSFTYMISSSQVFRVQSNEDMIQDNARYALEILSKNIRLAGHNREESSLAALDRMSIIYTDATCPADAVSGTGTGTDACTADIGGIGANLSDRFAIDYIASSGFGCNGQAISDGTHVASIFWSADPDDRGIRSLYCQPYDIDANTFIGVAQPIIDGVDAIQVQYGVDSVNNDGIVDIYQSYTEFAASGELSRNVRTMRVGLLLNSGVSIRGDQTETSAERTYVLLDGDQLTFDDRILRQIFTTTIFLANQYNDTNL